MEKENSTLECRNVSIEFPGVKALTNVNFSIGSGTIHAMLGANGISPHGRYNLKAMPNRRDIWGAEILAYYYVTWARVFPDKLDMIGLPYKKTYESALAMLDAIP